MSYPGFVCGQGPSIDQNVVNTMGIQQNPTHPGILDPTPNVHHLMTGETYRANDWTVTATVDGWVRFTNDATGHGVAEAPQNVDFF